MSDLLAKIKEALASLWAKIKALFTKEDDDIRPGRKDDDIVCYYGCPNSNRVKKLQLEKKLYK